MNCHYRLYHRNYIMDQAVRLNLQSVEHKKDTVQLKVYSLGASQTAIKFHLFHRQLFLS